MRKNLQAGALANITDQRTAFQGAPESGPALNQNLKTLAGRIDVSRYLRPTSDIVALIVLEHLTRMMHLMLAVIRQPDSAATMESLLTYTLFIDEAPLKERVTGSSSFTKTFAARGLWDARHRSLRNFDLTRRLFRTHLQAVV